MAPTIAAVMQGIETRLLTISGLRVTDTSTAQVTPPFAIVGVPPEIDYRLTMQRGVFQLNFTVTVLVSAALDRPGQLKLASYAVPTGSESIISAIEGDRTLGGLVADCVVDRFRSLGAEEVALINYFGGEFTVRVVASGA